MSEASRHRFLFLKNRLEELLSRHGPPPEIEGDTGVECDPSWGPLGTLAQQLLTEHELDHILALDREMGLEHAPETTSSGVNAQSIDPAQPAQNRVLEASTAMQRLDQYGETPLFGCPSCGAESAKASVPLDAWHCTACNVWGKASNLPRRGGDWTTPVHVA